MEIETSIAEGIRLTDDKARYDAACKRLLSEKILLAWIMKTCLDEYRDCDVNEIAEKYIEGSPEIGVTAVHPDETNAPRIHGAGTEDKSLNEGMVVYDIRFYAIAPSSGERIRLIINIEAQWGQSPGYPLIMRAIYYCCRMISSQYNTEFKNGEYQKIKKVYSIWLCINPAKNAKNSVTKYKMTEERMIGDVHEDVRNYDLLTVVMVCLGEPEDVEQKNILRLLNILFSDKCSVEEKKQLLEGDFDIQMTQTLERRLDEMCNLSQGVENRGIEKGMAKGMVLGAERTKLEDAQKLSQKLNISFREAMNILDIPEVDQQRFLELDRQHPFSFQRK